MAVVKHARVNAAGCIILDAVHTMQIPLAKSVRDDLSEAIHEAEGGDPIEWEAVVYRRATDAGSSRVWERDGKWWCRVWTKTGALIVETVRDEKEEAFAVADEALK